MYSIPLLLIIIDDKNATNSDKNSVVLAINLSVILVRAKRRFAD